MARALQCPDCGHRHPLDEVAHLRTFRCEECRRLLKVPASVGAKADAPPSDPTPEDPVDQVDEVDEVDGSEEDDVEDDPEDDEPEDEATEDDEHDADVTRMEDATAVVSASSSAGKVPPSQRGDAIARQARAAASDTGAAAPVAATVPRFVRAGIWLAALPIGLVPVMVAGRTIGFFSVDRAVDVFVGVGLGRFVPLVVVIIPWALISATIAHFGIEGVARMRASWGPAEP